MMSKKAKEYIENNSISDIDIIESEQPITGDDFIESNKAITAVSIAEREIEEKAIEAFRLFVEDYCQESGIKSIANDSEHYLDVFKKELQKY